MPIDYKDYPENWKTEIRPDILKRASDCCENCGAKNHKWVWYHPSLNYIFSQDVADAMRWYGVHEGNEHEQPSEGYMVCLTISHTNHDITDNSYENLMALCQTCHLRHDASYHAMNRVREQNRVLEEAGQMRLF